MVNAANGGGVTIYDCKWGDVLGDFRDPSGDGVGADTAELVHSCEPGDDGVVVDGDVAGEGPVIRKDDVIPYLAIVCDM